ncbi:MAG: hypothetical protein DWQ34_06485 [Planctomycetota bacterium]|nr:MAG: hypothetical protein DWQ29_19545 [Planctomycetota bacterium]REJ95345.1 MAG: hypothetical protein DWQ34_06485 [Planctomycetota bacterium]
MEAGIQRRFASHEVSASRRIRVRRLNRNSESFQFFVIQNPCESFEVPWDSCADQGVFNEVD